MHVIHIFFTFMYLKVWVLVIHVDFALCNLDIDSIDIDHYNSLI